MDKFFITATSHVTEADLRTAKPGGRSGRLDLASQLALLAVEALGVNFEALARDRIGICLAAAVGSLTTDVDFWKGRDAVGGPSPTLFAYTLPSAAVGEIAIRFKLTGPNLCFVGGAESVLPEAADLLRRGEAGGVVCVCSEVISPSAAEILRSPPAAAAWAIFLQRGGGGGRELRENDRDMKSWCALGSAPELAS